MVQKNISLTKGIFIFTIFTAYFGLLLYVLFPIIKKNIVFVEPIMYWIIIGYFLFIPIFLCAIFCVKIEGNHTIKNILSSLSIKAFSEKDWQYSLLGLVLVLVFSGMIYGGSIALNKLFEIRLLETHVWFMEVQPLKGQNIWVLFVWLPMFFFNIIGEELLWRGYIQSRLKKKQLWFVYSIMWILFHIFFGIDFMILLLPIAIIIPYMFSKQKNTLVGCFIHGMYNGPIFILLLLGIIK
jgi:membrane protease YdiL (CAAX protease family)